MDRVLGNPTLEVTIDRELALRYGLEPDHWPASCAIASRARRDDLQRDRPAHRHRACGCRSRSAATSTTVLASPVALPGGQTVTLRHLRAERVESRPVREIVRRDQRRQITISRDVEGAARRCLGRRRRRSSRPRAPERPQSSSPAASRRRSSAASATSAGRCCSRCCSST